MRTKSNTADSPSKEDVKYRTLLEEGLREFKELRKQILRDRAECARLRLSSQRIMEDTKATLRRVEANF